MASVGQVIHDISAGLVIPISSVANSKKTIYLTVSADGTLDNGTTRVNMQQSNNKAGVTDEWTNIESTLGPFLVVSDTIELKTNEFFGGFLRINLVGSATAGILTIKTYYKD